MGANGAGKSTWRREHHEDRPRHFYDADAIAQGLGGYDELEHQQAARKVASPSPGELGDHHRHNFLTAALDPLDELYYGIGDALDPLIELHVMDLSA